MQKQKKRNALTIFSIVIGITTLFIFISFGIGLQSYIDTTLSSTSANKIVIQPKGVGAPGLDTTFSITNEDIKVIEKTSGITQASGTFIKASQIKQESTVKYAYIIGYEPEKPLMLELSSIELESGRWLREGDEKKVVLGYNFLKENTIFKDEYVLGSKIQVDGIEMKVIGFFQEVGNPQDDSNIYITNKYFRELYPNQTGYAMVIAEASSTQNLDGTIQKVEEDLRRHRGQKEGKEDFTVQSYEQLLDSFLGAINIVYGFIILIAAISIIVSAINTANTMITSVLERTREIGVLKAIGAENSEIFTIFLFESATLGAIAGVIGVTIGYIFDQIATSLLITYGYASLAPATPVYLFMGAILFAIITGAISGIFPAINASRINTVEALRYE